MNIHKQCDISVLRILLGSVGIKRPDKNPTRKFGPDSNSTALKFPRQSGESKTIYIVLDSPDCRGNLSAVLLLSGPNFLVGFLSGLFIPTLPSKIRNTDISHCL